MCLQQILTFIYVMTSEIKDDKSCWYVLNHISTSFRTSAAREVDRFNGVEHAGLELFAPTYVVREEKNGEVRMKTARLTFHYVFVRGMFAQVKQLCGQSNGFSFVLNRSGASKYAVVSDREMAGFKNIARAYKNCLPYFSLSDIDLEDGDLVEVINGDFPGLVGTYMPKSRGKTGNIVLSIFNNVGTIAFDVRATDVRVLEFSGKSTRANDQIDAFIPQLLKALRLFHAGEALPAQLLAKLSIFCSRMEAVSLNNRKLNVKLQALLYGGNFVLGNMDVAERFAATYRKLSLSVTNEWTAALIALVFGVTTGDASLLATAYIRIRTLSASSRIQQMIVGEYEYYNSTTDVSV